MIIDEDDTPQCTEATLDPEVEFAACLRDLDVDVVGVDGETQMAETPAGQDIEPAWQACLVDTQDWLDDFVAEHS